MPKQTKVFTDFSGGEYSSKLEGRIDTPGYYKSCRKLENFIVAGQGGAERRPGTVFVANGKTGGNAIRLIPFELASGSYVLELGDQYMRFYKMHAQLGAPYEIATPWMLPYLFDIKYAQTKDTMYFTHPGYNVQKLTRTADTDWVLTDVSFVGEGAPAFQTASNRPSAIDFFQQRMWLAGSVNDPEKMWGSKVGSMEDFNSTDRLEFLVCYSKRFKIHWLTAQHLIVFGATKGEGILSGQGGPLSSTNFDLSVPSPIGCANVQGYVIGDIVIAFHKGLRKATALQYSNDIRAWKPVDLNFFSSHILGGGIVEADLQVDPDTVLWCVISDGKLVGFTYEPGTIMSWHRQSIGQTSDGNDKVESVAVIEYGPKDEIWISVKRKVNGTTKRFIEYFKPRKYGTDQADCYFVDCGITEDNGGAVAVTALTQAHPVVVSATDHGFLNTEKVRLWDLGGSTELNDQVWEVQNKTNGTFELKETDAFSTWDAGTTYHTGAIVEKTSKNYIALQESLNKDPTTETDYWALWPTAYTSGGYAQQVVISVSGLTHLEGETVQILADGATHPDKVVDESGAITLDRYANKIHVGLGYQSKLKPMRLTPPGVKKAAFKAVIRVYDSLGCKIGRSEDTLKVITFRAGDDPMDSAPPLFTGDKTKILTHAWDTDGDILIVQDQPLPLNIAALIVETEVNKIS